MKRFFVVLLLIFSQYNAVIGQILYDNATQELVLKAVDRIYNQEFGAVEPLAKQIRSKYPQHPVNPMLQALVLQWQAMPIYNNAAAMSRYKALLRDCIDKAKILEKDERTRPEASFFSMAGHGYIALIHNYKDENFKAATEGKNAYDYVIDGFKYMEQNPEFYFSTGLYNYYIIRYPEDHPIVKPVVMFFKKGNKELGLKQMEVAARKGVFTRTEAAFYLGRIYLKHEMKYGKAVQLLASVVNKYPNNGVFLMKYIEALLLNQQYEEATKNLPNLKKHTDKFFPVSYNVLEAIYQEKYLKNDQQAAYFYQEALRRPADPEYTKEYHGFAYAGLARIAHRAKDTQKAKIYYQKVLHIAEYKVLIQEAEAYLN